MFDNFTHSLSAFLSRPPFPLPPPPAPLLCNRCTRRRRLSLQRLPIRLVVFALRFFAPGFKWGYGQQSKQAVYWRPVGQFHVLRLFLVPLVATAVSSAVATTGSDRVWFIFLSYAQHTHIWHRTPQRPRLARGNSKKKDGSNRQLLTGECCSQHRRALQCNDNAMAL